MKTPGKTLIEFKNVDRKYVIGDRDYYALKEVDLAVCEGDMVVILGPSGAGKSTLLNLLGGLDSPTGGSIMFKGKNIAEFSDDELTAYRAFYVGVVFQFYNLIPTLTAYENVALTRDIRRSALKNKYFTDKEELGELMDPLKALKAVGLSERKDQFPSQMSGGEQQRVSIARAIAKNPSILLCDEPTGALDTDTGREVLKLLCDVSKQGGKTVIMVTHNSSFADIADCVVRVKNGTIISVTRNEHPKDAMEVTW